MKKFVFLNPDGVPSYTATPADDSYYQDGIVYNDMLCKEVPFDTVDTEILERWYWKGGEIKVRPLRPGDFYTWSSEFESWLPNLDAARKDRLQEVATELNKRLYLPCNGFDADKVSRERISGTIARLQRGDGLPAGWMGWRDAANEMHWTNDEPATVLANLTALSRAIEDREQALLIASWQHKANIAALEDIDAILGYDVNQGWPT